MDITTIKQYLDIYDNPIEFKPEPVNLTHSKFSIWGIRRARIVELPTGLKQFENKEQLLDAFINGQFVKPSFYQIDYKNDLLLIKFIKFLFDFTIDSTDEIIVRGVIQTY